MWRSSGTRRLLVRNTLGKNSGRASNGTAPGGCTGAIRVPEAGYWTALGRTGTLGAEGRQDFQRYWKNDRRALVAGNIAEGLQIAQLHRLRLLGKHLRRLQQLLRCLQFALRVNDLRATLALSLSLAGDCAHHRLVEIHLLDFDR